MKEILAKLLRNPLRVVLLFKLTFKLSVGKVRTKVGRKDKGL